MADNLNDDFWVKEDISDDDQVNLEHDDSGKVGVSNKEQTVKGLQAFLLTYFCCHGILCLMSTSVFSLFLLLS